MDSNIADSVVKRFADQLNDFVWEASVTVNTEKWCDLRLNAAIECKQLEQNEYETSIENNQQLQQQISKCDANTRVNAHKRVNELEQQNTQLMAQLESLNKEVVSLKSEYRESRKQQANMECAASDRQKRYQTQQNANQALTNRMNSINARMDSLENQLSFIADFRADISNWLQMSDEYNAKAEAIIKLKDKRFEITQNENTTLKHKLIEANSNTLNQTKHNEEVYEISRLNAMSELQNEEIEQLTKLLANAHKRNVWLNSLMEPIDEFEQNCSNVDFDKSLI